MRAAFAFVWLAVVAPAILPAAEIKVAENPVPTNSFAECAVTLGAGEAVTWDVYPEPVKVVDRGDGSLYFSGPAGRYKATATVFAVVDGRVKISKSVVVLTVGGCTAPQPPPTPTPTPEPTPVDPPKPVPDAPIAAPGLHVLVIYDAAKLSTLTAEQQGAIYGKDVRDYLRATCPKGPDGVTAEWRMWPSDVDAAGESQLWQDAMKRPRATLPWVIVSSPGKGGYEGPLPASAAAMLKLLKTYGEK